LANKIITEDICGETPIWSRKRCSFSSEFVNLKITNSYYNFAEIY